MYKYISGKDFITERQLILILKLNEMQNPQLAINSVELLSQKYIH